MSLLLVLIYTIAIRFNKSSIFFNSQKHVSDVPCASHTTNVFFIPVASNVSNTVTLVTWPGHTANGCFAKPLAVYFLLEPTDRRPSFSLRSSGL
jgi:hypothetical protein